MVLRREAIEERLKELDEVFENFQKGLGVFPRFAQEVLAWLDTLERD